MTDGKILYELAYEIVNIFVVSWNPYIAISCLGVAYSLLASALWPIAALLIPEYQLGTAYGLMQVKILNCFNKLCKHSDSRNFDVD